MTIREESLRILAKALVPDDEHYEKELYEQMEEFTPDASVHWASATTLHLFEIFNGETNPPPATLVAFIVRDVMQLLVYTCDYGPVEVIYEKKS